MINIFILKGTPQGVPFVFGIVCFMSLRGIKPTLVVRHCEAQCAEAIQNPALVFYKHFINHLRLVSGLPRRYAPRNDGRVSRLVNLIVRYP